MATSREEAIPLRSGEAADRVTGSGGHRVLSYQGGDPVLSGPSLDLSNHDDVPERRRVIRGIMRSVCVAGTMVRPLPPPSRRPPSAPLDPHLLVARRSTRLSATSDARHSDARPTRAHPLPPSPPLSRPRPPRRSSWRCGRRARARCRIRGAPSPASIWTPPSTPATRPGAVGPPPPPRAPSPPTSSPPPNHDSASAKRAKRARRTSRDSAVFLSPRRSSTSTTTSTARTSPWRSARGSAAPEATSTPSASRLRLPSSTRCCLIPGAP